MAIDPNLAADEATLADGEAQREMVSKSRGRIIRLPDDPKADRLGGLVVRWPLFDRKNKTDEGIICLIEAAIDAEAELDKRREPAPGDASASASYRALKVVRDKGFQLLRDRTLAHENSELEANDRDNAKRFQARFPDKLIDVRGRGFYAWNGRHWDSEGAEQAAFIMAGQVAAQIHEEARFLTDADPEEQQKKRDRRHTFAKNTGNHRPQGNMLEQLRTMCSRSVDDLDRDRLRIAVRNGTLQLRRLPADHGPDDRTVNFTPSHDPAHLVSQCLDVDYDPDAPCPRWEAFIAQVQPEEQRRLYLKTWAGLCLTGLTDHQAIVVHYGTGANGKSVFAKTMAGILGNSVALVAPESILGKNQRQGAQASPDLVRLIGKRCVQVHEYPLDEVLDEATVKRITGGEKIVVRELHQKPVEMEPRFKLEIYANDRPRVQGTTHGIWRRLNFVNWPVTIPDEEQRPFEVMIEEFAEERAGILNWLLDGVSYYLENGLRAPASVKEATENYKDESNPVGTFARECIMDAPEQTVSARYAFNSFKRWCEANAIRPFSETRFGTAMTGLGYKKKLSDGMKYLDIRLHNIPAPDLSDPRSPDEGSAEMRG